MRDLLVVTMMCIYFIFFLSINTISTRKCTLIEKLQDIFLSHFESSWFNAPTIGNFWFFKMVFIIISKHQKNKQVYGITISAIFIIFLFLWFLFFISYFTLIGEKLFFFRIIYLVCVWECLFNCFMWLIENVKKIVEHENVHINRFNIFDFDFFFVIRLEI